MLDSALAGLSGLRSGGLTTSSALGREGRRLDGGDELLNKSVEATLGVHPGTGVGAEMLSLNLWGVSGRGEVILLAFRGGRRDLRSAAARDEGRDGGLDKCRDDGGDSAGRTFW